MLQFVLYLALCSFAAKAAAQRIASGATDIAINWGLHHAKSAKPRGSATSTTSYSAYWSYCGPIHVCCTLTWTEMVWRRHFIEYFPGIETQEDKGMGRGKHYTVNFPLKDGITDESFKAVFEPVRLYLKYELSCISRSPTGHI
jgi:histone deacetylase 1/2